MITSAKKTEDSSKKNMFPDIYFLYQDGSLDEDSFVLENNNFLSINDHKTFGKVELYDEVNKYFIKQYRGGRVGEFIPDPYGAFYRPEDLSAKAVQRGTRFCEYVQVKEELFRTYQTYLINRNPAFFKAVEKAVANQEHI